jgi:hypothetical protein
VLSAMRSQQRQSRMEQLAEILGRYSGDRCKLRDLRRSHCFDESEVRKLADEYPNRLEILVSASDARREGGYPFTTAGPSAPRSLASGEAVGQRLRDRVFDDRMAQRPAVLENLIFESFGVLDVESGLKPSKRGLTSDRFFNFLQDFQAILYPRFGGRRLGLVLLRAVESYQPPRLSRRLSGSF